MYIILFYYIIFYNIKLYIEIGLLTGLRAHGHTGTRWHTMAHDGTRARDRFTGTRAHEESTGTRAHEESTGTRAHEESTGTQDTGRTGTRAWHSRGPQAPGHDENPRTHRRRNQGNSGNDGRITTLPRNNGEPT